MNRVTEIFTTILENARYGVITNISESDIRYLDKVKKKLKEHIDILYEQYQVGQYSDSTRDILVRKINTLNKTLINCEYGRYI